MRNKRLIPIAALLILLASCSESDGQNGRTIERVAAPQASEKAIHPLSMTALQNRQYPPSTIEIRQELGDRGLYVSYVVTFETDGMIQYALMNVPDSPVPENGYPVVIVCHGYIAPDVYTTVGSYKNTSAAFAAQGFLVLKPDYRGHGNSPGEADGLFRNIHFSIDVLNLLSSLASLDMADEDNVFLFGHSMGGEIGLRVLELADSLRGAAIWAPASAPFPENILFFRRGRDQEIDERTKSMMTGEGIVDTDQFSPIRNTDLIKVPVILRHSKQDESVPFQWGLDLAEAFGKTGVVHELVTYEQEDHNLGRGSFFNALEGDARFFRKLITRTKEPE